MKRTRLILVAAMMGFVLAGCDAKTRESTNSYIMPTELAEKGCKVYHMMAPSENTLDVVYCPNAQVTTHTKVGKSPQQSVTVVDEEGDYGY